MFPLASAAMLCGVSNWLGPLPGSPKDFTQSPFLSNFATRELMYPSLMKMLPWVSHVTSVDWRARRVDALPWFGAIVRSFLLAAKHHRHAAFWIELDNHIRAFVDGPEVVLPIDAHRVCERPGVQILADLADVFYRRDQTPGSAQPWRRRQAP